MKKIKYVFNWVKLAIVLIIVGLGEGLLGFFMGKNER
jgi:hypothetical protein